MSCDTLYTSKQVELVLSSCPPDSTSSLPLIRCAFYFSGQLGLVLNLSAEEISSKQMCFVTYNGLRDTLKEIVRKHLPKKRKIKVVKRKTKRGKFKIKVKGKKRGTKD